MRVSLERRLHNSSIICVSFGDRRSFCQKSKVERIEGVAGGNERQKYIHSETNKEKRESIDENFFLTEEFLALCFRVKEPIKTEEKDDNKGSGHKNLIFIISANSVTPSGNGHFNEKKFNRDSVQKPHFPYLVNRLSDRFVERN